MSFLRDEILLVNILNERMVFCFGWIKNNKNKGKCVCVYDVCRLNSVINWRRMACFEKGRVYSSHVSITLFRRVITVILISWRCCCFSCSISFSVLTRVSLVTVSPFLTTIVILRSASLNGFTLLGEFLLLRSCYVLRKLNLSDDIWDFHVLKKTHL